MDVAEKNDVPRGALGKDGEVRNEETGLTESTDVCEESDRALETSFRHLWSDYSADWKDTRRYSGDGAATPHRKLCMCLVTATMCDLLVLDFPNCVIILE